MCRVCTEVRRVACVCACVCVMGESPVMQSSRTHGNLCKGEPCTSGRQPHPAASPGRPARHVCSVKHIHRQARPPSPRQHPQSIGEGDCQSSFASVGPGYTDCGSGEHLSSLCTASRTDPEAGISQAALPASAVGGLLPGRTSSAPGPGHPLGTQFQRKETQTGTHTCTGRAPNLPPPVLLPFRSLVNLCSQL